MSEDDPKSKKNSDKSRHAYDNLHLEIIVETFGPLSGDGHLISEPYRLQLIKCPTGMPEMTSYALFPLLLLQS